MADEWDQFPDAPAVATPAAATPAVAAPGAADEWDQFPDVAAQPAKPRGQVYDRWPDGSLRPASTGWPIEERPQMDQWIQAGKNVGEAGLELGTGLTSAVASDVAGLGTLIADVATFGKFDLDPEGVRNRVRDATQYRASDPNNFTASILRKPGEVIGGAGDYLASKTDNPYLQHVLRAIPQAAVSYLGIKAGAPVRSPQGVAIPRQVDTRPPTAPEITPQQMAIKEAADINIKLPPSYVGNTAGNVAEGLAGRAPLLRDLSLQNAKSVNTAAAKHVGITDKPLTRASIGIERARANKAYADISKTGVRQTSDDFRAEIQSIGDRSGGGSFPDDAPPAVANLKQMYSRVERFDAADAVARIRQLRKDASANYKTRDPDKAAVANVQQKIADALDNELARHVDSLGQPKLAADYKAARVKLAKLRTVEEALQGGNVSAQKIHQQWKRGAPLDGELLAIAKAYDNFPQVLQNANKLAGTHPFSAVDYLVGSVGTAAGAAFNPALLASIAARPVTRKILASDAYQRRFVQPKGRTQETTRRQSGVNPKAGAPVQAVRDEPRRRQAR